MDLNEYIITTFNALPLQSQYVILTPDSYILKTGNAYLTGINHKDILLAQKLSLLSKIQTTNTKTDILASNKVRDFLKVIEPKFVRLNHVGISYFCNDLQEELKVYKNALLGTGLRIYQEQSESVNEKWLFIGDTNDWEAPLCEIVLNFSQTDYYKEWVPAFQVDIDTTFTMQELEDIAIRHCGDNFWKWKLDVPDYGVILAMAILGEINGTKITLGVGTNLRNTKGHRVSMKEVA